MPRRAPNWLSPISLLGRTRSRHRLPGTEVLSTSPGRGPEVPAASWRDRGGASLRSVGFRRVDLLFSALGRSTRRAQTALAGDGGSGLRSPRLRRRVWRSVGSRVRSIASRCGRRVLSCHGARRPPRHAPARKPEGSPSDRRCKKLSTSAIPASETSASAWLGLVNGGRGAEPRSGLKKHSGAGIL
jgi:hypothetical protein